MSAWTGFNEEQTEALRRVLSDGSFTVDANKKNSDNCTALLALLPAPLRDQLGSQLSKDRLFKKIMSAYEAEKQAASIDEYLLPAESSTDKHAAASTPPPSAAAATPSEPITEQSWFKQRLAEIDSWSRSNQ